MGMMKGALLRVQGRLHRAGRCVRKVVPKTGLSSISKPKRSAKTRPADKASQEQTAQSPQDILQGLTHRESGTPFPSKAVASDAANAKREADWPMVDANPLASTAEGEPVVSYLEGSPRLMWAKYDVKQGVTILPDADLFEALKGAVLERRRVDCAEVSQRRRLGRLLGLHESIDEKVADLESCIAQSERFSTEEKAKERSGLQEELRVLVRKRSEALEAHRACHRALDERFLSQRENLLDLIYTFEQMFVADGLMEEEEEGPKGAEEDLDTDKSMCIAGSPSAALLSDDQGDRTLRHKSSLDNLRAVDAEHENDRASRAEAKQLTENYQPMQTRLYVVEQSFENRVEWFERGEAERKQKLEAGEAVETTSAFDRRQLEDTRVLTRQLIDAEEALEAAKAAAVAAGVQVPGSEVESGFVDDVDDGYRLSSEDDEGTGVNRTAIEAWLELVPKFDTNEIPEVGIDDWEARSVEICDSSSMVAEGGERRRIDKWRAMCAKKADEG